MPFIWSNGVAAGEEGQAVAGVLVLALPQVPGQPCLRVQLVVVEAGFHRLDRGGHPRFLLARAGLGHVVQLVVELLAALEAELDRAELQLFLVLRVEPRIEACGLGLDLFGAGRGSGGRCRRGIGGRLRAGGQAEAQCNGKGEGSA
jgi:hypothetical protein